jgi:hypothetical protein
MGQRSIDLAQQLLSCFNAQDFRKIPDLVSKDCTFHNSHLPFVSVKGLLFLFDRLAEAFPNLNLDCTIAGESRAPNRIFFTNHIKGTMLGVLDLRPFGFGVYEPTMRPISVSAGKGNVRFADGEFVRVEFSEPNGLAVLHSAGIPIEVTYKGSFFKIERELVAKVKI